MVWTLKGHEGALYYKHKKDALSRAARDGDGVERLIRVKLVGDRSKVKYNDPFA